MVVVVLEKYSHSEPVGALPSQTKTGSLGYTFFVFLVVGIGTSSSVVHGEEDGTR